MTRTAPESRAASLLRHPRRVALALTLAVAACAMQMDWADEALPDPAQALHNTEHAVTSQPRMVAVIMHDPLGQIVQPERASSSVTEPAPIPGSMGNLMGASAPAPVLPPTRGRTGPGRGSATDEGEDSLSPGSPAAPRTSGWGWLADGAAARIAPPAASLPNRAWKDAGRDLSSMTGLRGDADDFLLPSALVDPMGERARDALPFTFEAPAGGSDRGSRGWTPLNWAQDPAEMR